MSLFMRKVAIAIVFLLSVLGGQLYSQGIEFKHITFEEALNKAKTDNKLVFIDFYTAWCGPCKTMSAYVFTNEMVGDAYNREFICIKLDAEKEGLDAAKKYKVDAYPTLIFLNGEGELIYKKVGSCDIATIQQLGKKAIEAVRSGYTISELKEQYPNKLNDERFLKMYIDKMVDVREDPSDAIEAWLKIQTSIKEQDVDMMEFLMDHSKYLRIDGKAEEILDTNFDEYMNIATRAEETVLTRLKYNLAYNTMKQAYAEKNPKLLRSFITNWKELPDSKYKSGNLKDYEMDYLLFAQEYDKYKVQAQNYLDSLKTEKTLEQIHKDDQASYEYYKNTEYSPSLLGNSTLEYYRKGKEATEKMKIFNKVIRYYSHYCATKKADYKRIYAWIDFASQLVPEDFSIDNLHSNILKKQGNMKEAIKYKELAISKMPEGDRNRTELEKQLTNMKN